MTAHEAWLRHAAKFQARRSAKVGASANTRLVGEQHGSE